MKTKDLKENKAHGTAILPVATYIETIGINLREFPLHWHHQIEFVYIAEGKGFFTLNLQKHSVKKGDYLLVPPNALHAFTPLPDHTCTCHTIVVDLSFIESMMLDAITRDYITPIINGDVCYIQHFNPKLKGYPLIQACHEKIITLQKEKPAHYPLKLKAYLFELLVHLFDSNVIYSEKGPQKANDDIKALRQVLKYIDIHKSENISISVLAAIAGYSDDYFIRFFKNKLHQTPINYIKNCRLDYAKTLLDSQHLNITEVAHESGFNSVSYFIKCFKVQYGITPKAYRKMVTSNASA